MQVLHYSYTTKLGFSCEYYFLEGKMEADWDGNFPDGAKRVVFCVPIAELPEGKDYWKREDRCYPVEFTVADSELVYIGYPGSVRFQDFPTNFKKYLREGCAGFEFIVRESQICKLSNLQP